MPSYQSAAANATLDSPSRRALSRATDSAASERSVAVSAAFGRSCANASAIAPEPVPRSSTRTARSPGSFDNANSTSVSVSGRGINTSGVTDSMSPQNSREPVRYATGSPARRRRHSAANASACAFVSMSVSCAASHARLPPNTCASSAFASTGTSPLCASAWRTVGVMTLRVPPRTAADGGCNTVPSPGPSVPPSSARAATPCCREP